MIVRPANRQVHFHVAPGARSLIPEIVRKMPRVLPIVAMYVYDHGERIPHAEKCLYLASVLLDAVVWTSQFGFRLEVVCVA